LLRIPEINHPARLRSFLTESVEPLADSPGAAPRPAEAVSPAQTESGAVSAHGLEEEIVFPG
jgi:hypothetical protein